MCNTCLLHGSETDTRKKKNPHHVIQSRSSPGSKIRIVQNPWHFASHMLWTFHASSRERMLRSKRNPTNHAWPRFGGKIASFSAASLARIGGGCASLVRLAAGHSPCSFLTFVTVCCNTTTASLFCIVARFEFEPQIHETQSYHTSCPGNMRRRNLHPEYGNMSPCKHWKRRTPN